MSYEYNDSYDLEELIDTLNNKISKISDLEAKLAESEKNYIELFCRNTKLETLYSQKTALLNFYKDTDLVKENKELKQQLAEKDREILKISEYFGKVTFELRELCNKKDQDKISFALEQLEMAKEKIMKVPITDYDFSGNFEKMYKQDAIRQIDNQIKQLKEGK
jgi:hypothetical protein